MKLVILASLCCFALVINAATVPFSLTEDEINNQALIRTRRSPLLLTALGAAGLVGAGIVGAGLAGLAGAGLVGAGLGAKAGFAAGALTSSAARSYGGGYYHTYYVPRSIGTDYHYMAQLKVNA